MHSRREFLKRAAMVGGTAALTDSLSLAVERAMAIQPVPGSSFLDAEHVVILMQENRSFDHAFGTLQGVRGFNDPRAIMLPNGNPVWVQTNDAGESYVPFRLNIKDSKATWMGCLPHGWSDQSDARNDGRYDRWLQSKRSGVPEFKDMPLTLGHYTRDDIPFYYALADAFTICDQNFCSSLTGTTPNRLHLWTGTIRARQSADSPANVRNEDADYATEVDWITFPERLEELGVSWKIYQNELSIATGLAEEAEAMLANFGDNPIEYFKRFGVRFSDMHRAFLKQQAKSVEAEVSALKKQARRGGSNAKSAAQLVEKEAALARLNEQRARWTLENFKNLSPREQSLHAKAFCTNAADPNYRQLETLTYRDGGQERQVDVPKGDLFHQFRKDCQSGELPMVSWLVAPQRFSDHPDSAWYGAWYIAEAMNILTHNPDVWKKTIFILTYDENDGYFDHVPPFVAPRPNHPETGRASQGIDTSLEHVALEDDRKRSPGGGARGGPIGLGYRVPMIIASPWSRGGCVCSQVFDHTSPLQFLEKLLTHKLGRPVKELNINSWRRTVCGDLTAAFQPAVAERAELSFPPRDAFVEEIHRAMFKPLPAGYQQLTEADIAEMKQHRFTYARMPQQEPGVRRSSPLPYQLEVDGKLNEERTAFIIDFAAHDELFGSKAAGSPFTAYVYLGAEKLETRNYAVAAGDSVADAWQLEDFSNGVYSLKVHAPNGFFREFRGDRDDPAVDVRLAYARTGPDARVLSGDIEIHAKGRGNQNAVLEVRDESYGGGVQKVSIAPGKAEIIAVSTEKNFGWYDLSIRIGEQGEFLKRYAGRVETGKWGYSDPAMGRSVKS